MFIELTRKNLNDTEPPVRRITVNADRIMYVEAVQNHPGCAWVAIDAGAGEGIFGHVVEESYEQVQDMLKPVACGFIVLTQAAPDKKWLLNVDHIESVDTDSHIWLQDGDVDKCFAVVMESFETILGLIGIAKGGRVIGAPET